MEKRKTAKKILSLFLTLAMLLSMMSVAAFAEEGAEPPAEPPAEHTEHLEDDGTSVEDGGETNFEEFSSSEENKILFENLDDNSIDPLNIPAPGDTVSESLTIDAGGEDVTITNVTFGENVDLTVNTTGSVTLTNCTFAARSDKGRNARVLLNVGSASITGNNFGNDAYNVIEFAQKNTPLQSADITGNTFGTAGNNYISAYLFAEGAEVTVSGNTFDSTARNDIVRISNYDNTKDVTVNVSNNTLGSDVDAVVMFQKTSKHEDVFTGVKLTVTDQDTPGKLFYVYGGGTTITDANQQPIVATDEPGDNVAEVNGMYYSSLQAAIDAVPKNRTATIEMVADSDQPAIIPKGKNITLNILENVTLSNKNGTLGGSWGNTTLQNHGTLTITGGGTIVSEGVSNGGFALKNFEGGVAKLNGCTFKSNRNDYVVWNLGTMTVDGAIITGTGGDMTAVYNGWRDNEFDKNRTDYDARLTMKSGSITNVTKNKAAVLNNDWATFIMEGGEIKAPLCVLNWDTAQIKGGTLTVDGNGTKVISSGGASANYNRGQLSISGGEFYKESTSETINVINTSEKERQISITGGTFFEDVKDYCASGYTTQENEGGTWTVIVDESKAVARIGETLYVTLQDAIKAADEGDTVVLLKDISETVGVAAGKDIILDLNGKTLQNGGKDSEGKDYIITIQNLGTLTIQDNSEAQTGTIKSTGADDAIDNYGTLNVESGTIQGGTAWYGIYAGSNSNTNVYGTAKVTGEYWGIAAGSQVSSDTQINVYGNVEITSRNPAGTNGGISASKATTQVYGNAKVTGPCGINTNGSLTISGNAYIEANHESAGTAIGLYTGADVKVEGGTIKGGAYGISGNGASDGTTVAVNGGTISGIGAGIYHPQEGTLTITGGEITGGVGVQMCDGTLNISGANTRITGTAADESATKTGDGTIIDGAAVSLVKRGGGYGTPNAKIAGGRFTSEQAAAIAVYGWSNSNPAKTEWIPTKEEVAFTGGDFSSDVDAYCADGYVSHTVSTPANYWNVHQQGAGWHFNASEHWQGCNAANCTEGRTSVGSHTYTSSVTTQPTYDALGVRTYTCTVCSRSYTESIARLTRPSGGGGGGGYRPSGGGGGGTVNIDDPDVPLAGGVELNREDHFAYVSGYEDGTVRPGNNVTREEVAAIFYRLLTETSHTLYDTDANDFSDVDSGRWSNRAISTLVNAGVLSGYPDGTFRPGQSITRAEFAAIAAQFDAVTEDVENPFSDTAGHWAETLISFTAAKGWVGGYTDGTFKPQKAITRAEAMTLVNNVLEREVDEEGLLSSAKQWPDSQKGVWYYYEVLEATNSHDYTRRGSGTVENWTAIK